MKNTALYIGLAGAIGMAVCDVILLGQPVSGSAYDMSSFGAMPFITEERARLGATGGVLCAFLICFGFWYLKGKFENTNPTLALWLFISLCSVEFFGGAFHAGYYYLAGVSPQQLPEMTRHLEFISFLGVPGYIIGTILFFRLALAVNFPKWLRFANLLLIHGALLLIFMALPAPIGGYLKPTFINVGLAIFLVANAATSKE